MNQQAEMLIAINTSAADVYRRWKHDLHKYYVLNGRDSVPDEFLQRKDEWNWLVGHFDSPEYQRRSTANKNNRDKKVYHHGSGSCKIINIAKQHMVAGSKYPHIDVAYDAYFRSDREDDIASQRVVMMKQLAEQKLTEQQSQNPDTPPIQQSPLSLDTEISISDQFGAIELGKRFVPLDVPFTES